MPTMYRRSSGEEVAIETMEFHHLKPALAKLLRERKGEARQVEIDAMTKRMEVLEAEHAAKTEGVGANAEPTAESASLAAELEPNPREVIGGNNPPVERPFDLIREHLEGLLLEARNWADGATVETQAQADEINRLKADLADGATAAEAERVKEKKPLDDAVAEIQDRYNLYIAPRTNKKPGKVTLAIQALNAALTPFLQKLEDDKRAVAEAARKEAELKASIAAAAIQQAAASDMTARESAEDLIAEAEAAAAVAKRAEGDKAHAHGGVRATGLRSFWTVRVTDSRAALLHYINTNRPAIDRFVEQLAQADLTAGKRQIPGCEVTEERRVA